MTKTRKIIVAVLSVLVLGLLIGVGLIGSGIYQNWVTRPLGASIPTLPNTLVPLSPTWTALPYWLPSVTPASGTLIVETSAIQAPPLCGGPRVMNILLIGSDTRGTDYTYGLADVTRRRARGLCHAERDHA